MTHSGINHDQSEPLSKAIIFYTGIFTVSLIVISLIAVIIYKSEINIALNNSENTAPNKELAKLRNHEAEQFKSYKISIESAKQQVVENSR